MLSFAINDKFKKKKGYTLINVMLLLASMAMIATLQFRDQVFKLDLQKAIIAGQQIRLVNDAVEGYLAAHNTPLAGMKDDDCAGSDGCTPSVSYCAVSAAAPDQCELNLGRLVDEGYLPPGWNNTNAWGSPYKTVVTRLLKPNAVTAANAMDYNIRAITVTQNPWADERGVILLGLLGQAVKSGGQDLAVTSADASTAHGLVRRSYNATMTAGTLVSWTADSSMNPNLNSVGQLVARAGFEASANNAFPDLLRRNGSNMMKNNLNLGEQRINNTQDAFVKNLSKNTSGGRNLASLGPTWVFKYSWRVGADQESIKKPDCSTASGGFTRRTTLVNAWDSSYNSRDITENNKAYDTGEPRILVINDTLKDMQTLGYLDQSSAPAPYNNGAVCPRDLTTSSASVGTSCPGHDPNTAYDPAFRTRARGAYTFYAVDNGDNWLVNMKYYQNGTSNTAVNASNAQGIASVYCYYDNQRSSGCNGEIGCAYDGKVGPGASSAKLLSPSAATTSAFTQSPSTSGTPSQLPAGVGGTGAKDVAVVF